MTFLRRGKIFLLSGDFSVLIDECLSRSQKRGSYKRDQCQRGIVNHRKTILVRCQAPRSPFGESSLFFLKLICLSSVTTADRFPRYESIILRKRMLTNGGSASTLILDVAHLNQIIISGFQRFVLRTLNFMAWTLLNSLCEVWVLY